MSHLSISLLGPFAASLDDAPIESFRTKSVQALFIYLVCEAKRLHQRETLMVMLWPGMPLESAQANMRQTVYRLRKVIPEVKGKNGTAVPFLNTDRQTIQINSDADYYLDIDVFAVNERSQAIALYRGDFLADFYLPEREGFEEWAAGRRADYRRQVLEMLAGETAEQIQYADFEEAIQLARRQIEIDNLRESGHRQLIEALARNGRRQEALSHYTHLCLLLADELALEPEPETAALIEVIRAGEIAAAEKVCAGGDIDAYEVLDLLASLVDKSLVLAQDTTQGVRYHRLETIRQYAREKFLEVAEVTILRDRHLAYYLTLVETAETELVGPHHVRWLGRLNDEWENIDAALTWSLARLGTPVTLVTTDYIFDETVTLLMKRNGKQQAVRFGKWAQTAENIALIPIDNETWQAAWEMFQSYNDKQWAFTDCTSFALMRQHNLHRAFAFDRHFEQAGFLLWPGMDG